MIESGIGVFWGHEDPSTQLPQLTRVHPKGSKKRHRPTQQHTISLPNLRDAHRTELLVPRASDNSGPQTSLLAVLQTLWRSIAMDTHTFVDKIITGHVPTNVDPKRLNAPYYDRGVFMEDRQYFLEEHKAELNKQRNRERIQQMRELHCATDDQQHYHCDRTRGLDNGHRKHNQKNTASKRDAAKMIEDRLIDRHDHKMQHLLHVLQAEIAAETQREIRSFKLWDPTRALSRQSRRHVSDIIKERYEAADRIMRILEDYHVVVGVDAAKYLEHTIAQGRALLHQ